MPTAAHRAGTAPWTFEEMIELAARGVGKVDHHGRRGITMCSAAEIEAMAATLATLGLSPIPPGAPVPPGFSFKIGELS